MDGYHVAQIIFLFDERVTDQAEIGKFNHGVLYMKCLMFCLLWQLL